MLKYGLKCDQSKICISFRYEQIWQMAEATGHENMEMKPRVD